MVFSRTEIERILKSTKNIKHKILLSLSYGAGLRASEVVALRVRDIDLHELTIHIKQAKRQNKRFT